MSGCFELHSPIKCDCCVRSDDVIINYYGKFIAFYFKLN